MSLIENIKIAIEGLKLNKMRSFLTMLGIIIGISSVIGIWTIGRAMSNSVSKGFDQFGNTSIYVSVRPKEGQSWDLLSSTDNIKASAVEELEHRLSDKINAVVIEGVGGNGTVKSGRKTANIRISPTTSGSQQLNNIKMIAGRFLEDNDNRQNKEVVVVSDKVVKEIFDGKTEKALGSELAVNTNNGLRVYLIVGVYKHERINFGVLGGEENSETTTAYIPLSVGNRQYASKDVDTSSYQYISILAKNRETIESTSKEIESFFNDNYYKNNTKAEVKASSVQSQLNEINKVMGTIKVAIGAIAAISLIVGGIGVMNILLVSVTERTREIGIRKALGATSADIKGQFIIESVIICIIGGALGVLLGGGIGFAGSYLMQSPTLPSLLSIVVAVGFSMFIGIFFGYYPSNKAASLNPIDALRYE